MLSSDSPGNADADSVRILMIRLVPSSNVPASISPILAAFNACQNCVRLSFAFTWLLPAFQKRAYLPVQGETYSHMNFLCCPEGGMSCLQLCIPEHRTRSQCQSLTQSFNPICRKFAFPPIFCLQWQTIQSQPDMRFFFDAVWKSQISKFQC